MVTAIVLAMDIGVGVGAFRVRVRVRVGVKIAGRVRDVTGCAVRVTVKLGLG